MWDVHTAAGNLATHQDLARKIEETWVTLFARRACPGLQGFLFQIDTNQIPESTRSETRRRGHTTVPGVRDFPKDRLQDL